MYFDRVYITSDGYDLLGAATAGSSQDQPNTTIIWGQVFTSSVDISGWTQSEINSATADSFATDMYTSSGVVTSAVPIQKEITVDDQTIKVNTVTVTIDINNNQYDGIANTLCVFAKLDGDEESKLVIVASADNPETVHPLPQPYKAIIDLYIELSSTAVSAVSANSSWYASASAFNAIANRVVTTHSENLPTTGEDQDVYGVKTFKNDIRTSNVIPSGNFTVDLGDSTHNYKNVFARTVSQSVMECSTAANLAAKLVVSTQAPNFNTPISGDRILVKFTNGNSVAIPTIKIGDSEAHSVLGLRTDLSAGAVVPMTFSDNAWNVDGFLSVAKQVAVSVNNESSEYSVVFTDAPPSRLIPGIGTNKELYTDNNADGTLKYNPGTNTLTCATFDGEATQLSESPVVSFTDATSSTAGSTLTVTAGGKTSDTATISTVRRAYNAYIDASNLRTEYVLPFTAPYASQSVGFKKLYIDTSDSLKYNPYSNVLTTSGLKCTSLDVSSSFNLSPAAVVAFAKQLGVELALIDIYSAQYSGGDAFDKDVDDIVTFGSGASASQGRSNFTICANGSKTTYLTGSFRVTKLVSAGITSSTSNSITINGYTSCANPNYGTPCVCLAIRI